MRKLSILLSTLIISVFLLCGTSFAFQLGVYADKSGSADFTDNVWTYGLGTDQIAGQDDKQYTSIDGSSNNAGILTQQDFGADGILGNNDTFTESISWSVTNFLNKDLNNKEEIGTTDNWKFQVDLNGYITDYSNPNDVDINDNTSYENIQDASYTSVFTGGSGLLYHDEDTNDEPIGDTTIAQFDFTQGDNIDLTPTVFTGGDLGDQITLSFDWTYANSDYFKNELFDPSGASLQDFISLDLAFSTSQGSIFGVDDIGIDEVQNNKLTIPFGTTPTKADFQAVPEPTTLLLFGTGLLGLAAFGRKKFMNKN